MAQSIPSVPIPPSNCWAVVFFLNCCKRPTLGPNGSRKNPTLRLKIPGEKGTFGIVYRQAKISLAFGHELIKVLINFLLQERDKDKPVERRPFDREKDLNLPTMTDGQKKSIIRKSKELGSRFHHAQSGSSFL